jgi:hypothetical protein
VIEYAEYRPPFLKINFWCPNYNYEGRKSWRGEALSQRFKNCKMIVWSDGD